MKCTKVVELLPVLAEKMLGPKDVAEVTEHLHSCTACGRAWKRHQAVEHFFVVEQAPEKPASFWEHQRRRILDQIAWSPADRRAQALPSIRTRFIAVGIAAAALLAIGLVSLLRSNTTPAAPEPNVVREAAPEKQPEVVKEEPKKTPEQPDITQAPEPVKPEPKEPKKEEAVVDNAPKSEPPKPEPKKEEPVVDNTPKNEPKTEPPKEPKKEEPVVDNTPKAEPKPEPKSEKPVVAILMPGDEGYVAKLADEMVAVFLAKTEAESMTALLAASRARLDEIAFAVDKKHEALAELGDAYAALLGEGVSEVITRRMDAKIRQAAQQEAAAQYKLLVGTKGVENAISAAKAAAELRLHRPSYKTRGSLGVLGIMRETAEIGSAKDFDGRIAAANVVIERRIVEIYKAIQSKQEFEAAALVYERVLVRGHVEVMTAAYNAGIDVTGEKRLLMKGLQNYIDTLTRLEKGAAVNLKGKTGEVIGVTRTAREAIAKIPDGVNPNVKGAKGETAPPQNPEKPTKPPGGKVDPGFDPNDPNAPKKDAPPPEKGFEPK